jgi:hypothetical protein
MCVALGDTGARGVLDVYVTNISERGYLFQGNNLRYNELAAKRQFSQAAKDQVADCGWAWGSQFGDLDNDGRVDLFVCNGFVSGDREKDYWYGMSKIAGGAGPVFEDAANWPAMGNLSLSGYTRTRVLRNLGGSEFVDVAVACGAIETEDGRAIAMVDLFNRGRLDCVVANQNQPARVYLNDATDAADTATHNWITFELRGRDRNRFAIGAEVIVTAGGRKHRRVIDGGSGFCSQNDRRLHVGLGDANKIDSIEIRWPGGDAGEVHDVAGLEPNRIHRIEEPRQ